MQDYFETGGTAATETGAATNGVAQPGANGDVMEDEVLVSLYLNSSPAYSADMTP